MDIQNATKEEKLIKLEDIKLQLRPERAPNDLQNVMVEPDQQADLIEEAMEIINSI